MVLRVRAALIAGVFAVACIVAVGEARAMTLGFGCLTQNLAGDCAIGEAQLTVEVTDAGGNQVLFSLTNSGPATSAASEVYFDDGTLLGLASIDDSDPGVSFSQFPINPPDLPGGNLATPPFVVTAGFHANASSPPSANGVGAGETLGILFDLEVGGTFADVLDDLNTGALRIGIHVIGFDSGGSESFINTPEPNVIAVLGLALVALAARRARA